MGRKTKYWINNSYPYINVTFNTKHNDAIVTTREIESQYPIKDKWFKDKKMAEQVREVPISKSIKLVILLVWIYIIYILRESFIKIPNIT